MVNPHELLNDFAAIKGGETGGCAQKNTGRSANHAAGFYETGGSMPGTGTGAETKPKASSDKGCDVNTKCDIKSVITPGDPKQKSSMIAMKAAQDAKAASEAQSAAGQAAAHHIKLELAEKAFQSAKAAEAALMGKQMMVDQLEQEVQEADAVVEEETNSIHHTEANMNAAVDAPLHLLPHHLHHHLPHHHHHLHHLLRLLLLHPHRNPPTPRRSNNTLEMGVRWRPLHRSTPEM